MVEYDRKQPNESSGKDPLRICVAGVGGAGSNVLDRIAVDRVVDASLVSFQTDIRVLNRSNVSNRIQLGTELMRGVGSGGDPDVGREAALFSRDQIHQAIEGHDMVFISAGLGGGTGSGAAPVIAEIAKNSGAMVVVFATVPFTFEGRRRTQQANDALERMNKSSDALILFDNNRMGELVLPKDGIQKAFQQGDQLIAQSVRAVTTMVGSPGLVKLGLDDLTAALRMSEGRCLFGFGEGKGQNRGADALKKALKSPLINQGELLQNAKNLLVHIVGGESLTLVEVEGIMRQLGRHVPDETQILFGLGVEPKLGDAVTLTLVSALSAHQLATARRTEEVQAAPQPVPAAIVSRPAPAPKAPATPPPTPPPADLFEEPAAAEVEVEPAPPLPVVERIAPAPVPAAPPPLPRAEVAPPPPPPAPVEEELVYQAPVEIDEEEPAPAPAPKPRRESARVRLSSLIQPEAAVKPAAAPPPPVDEVELMDEPAPTARVLAPVPETASIPLSQAATPTVRAIPTPASDPVVVARALENEAPNRDLFGGNTDEAPAAKKTAAEQQTMRFEDSRPTRFKDTEHAYAQGNEDLDTPTWMRLRRKR